MCFDFIAISQRTILEIGGCDFTQSDTADLRVFPRNCYRRETKEECIRWSAKVLDVIKIALDPYGYCKFTMMITEKMPSVVIPFCLFNRDNAMDSQLKRESPYFQWSPYQTDPPIPANMTSQSNCRRVLNSDELSTLETEKIPIQNILCVEETFWQFWYVINFYKGRYFLRGLKFHWNHRYYVDILLYIDQIAMHAKDISALRPIPEIKQPKGFNAPDNLSFGNCGRKPTSTGTKLEKDDSSTEIPSIAGQIFRGNISQTGDHPWHVYIENLMTGGACGGTLISPTVVLTAAHCIYGSKAEDFRVSLGLYDKRKRRAPGVQRRKLSSMITHPKYDSAEFISDVGLVILKKKVKITNNVRPICLWNDDSDSNLARVAGTKAMAVGFGLVDNHTRTDDLQEVRLPILTHKECYLSKRNFFAKYLRPGDNFCAGYTNGTTTCNGDSGGSLSVEKDGRWFIRGIVSFGMSKIVKFKGRNISLCHPYQYTLFADIARSIDWIVPNTPEISFRKIQRCRWYSIFFGK
ncbi:clotting factor B-like [Cloeon dipterum]|uniref:clotting factor B-like n=1 Tax=Cloeon dipterum TaxID=197152 RepID=UPI00321FF719